MRFLRRAAALSIVLAAEGVALVAVHRLGSREPFNLPLDQFDPWLHAAPEDALAAAVRLVALVCAWWVLASTLAYACARFVGIPAAIRACERATPRVVRRAVDRALAASMALSAFTVPVHSGRAPGPVIIDVRSGRQATAGSVASLPSDTGVARTGTRPPAAPPATPSSPAPLVPARAEEASTGSVVVEPGDSLWTIAAEALSRATGRDRATLSDGEVARYWNVVCDANRTALRSGDVDLIAPGEVVALPPVP